jgi:hypothetical protein
MDKNQRHYRRDRHIHEIISQQYGGDDLIHFVQNPLQSKRPFHPLGQHMAQLDLA